jgi:hypothetical protein
MSKTTQNSITKYYSGKFGQDFVLRNIDGMSVLAKLPKPSDKPRSPKQLVINRSFTRAVNYAKLAMADPELLELYIAKGKQIGKSAYRLALSDYLVPPKIEEIDADHYHGIVGNLITLVVSSDLKVIQVNLKIMAGNSVIEEGDCVVQAINQVWVYKAKVAVTDISGLTITATAYGIPGNKGEAFIII